MKKTMLLLLLTLGTAQAVTIIPPASGWTIFTDEEHLYSIPVPPGFKVVVMDVMGHAKTTMHRPRQASVIISIDRRLPVEVEANKDPRVEKIFAAEGRKVNRHGQFAQWPAMTIEG